MKLKNISDKERGGGSVIDIIMTEHPISKPREWTELPVDRFTGQVDRLQSRGFDPKDQSKAYHVVIKPGGIVEFGEGHEFNEEHAEYLYATYGSRETLAALRESPIRNWLIEIDDNDMEIKGQGTLHDKYRANYSLV